MEPEYIRAEYDEECGSFVSSDAEIVDDTPSLEYRFSLNECDDPDYPWEGGIEKCWREADGEFYSEYHPFARYPDEQSFERDTVEILAQARANAESENVDELLAVLDIVKERAVDNDYDDGEMLEIEGLFQHGPEDAYTLCDIGAEYRLHHHIERDDECWLLHTLPVVDQNNHPLGWGLVAIHIPALTSEATHEEIKLAEQARILLVDHCSSKAEALYSKHGFAHLMDDGERVENPEYSRMNDTEVIGYFAVDADWDNQEGTAIWQQCSRKELQAFLEGSKPFIRDRDRWKPRPKPLVDQFFKHNPQPQWIEDQLRAALDQGVGVESEVDEDSPWNNAELDGD